MKKLYIVFDQIPSKESGGLIATYFNLVKLLDQDFEIHIVSIFNTNKKNKIYLINIQYMLLIKI